MNNHGQYGRWAFAKFTEVYQIESYFEAKVEDEFDRMIRASLEGNLFDTSNAIIVYTVLVQ